MRTTVDIPDPLYRELKSKAALEGRTVKELILRSVEEQLGKHTTQPRRRITVPLVPSSEPGSLNIDNEGIFEIIPFP
ncbi:MAG: hypothetical protein JOZ33_01940 [Acidobacteriaceae bacterium]|nr:hypothetical protein [Acidobacteriaceae bacterium]